MAFHTALNPGTGTGSQSCIESLKNDLRSFQGGLREVLSKTEGLQVPSWKFPERLAVSVDIEELLRDVSYSSKDKERNCFTHVLLLELVVDRLLLLLQSCLKFSDITLRNSCNGSVPLTLGSVVKKFSRVFIKDTLAAQDSKQQESAKDEKITSLESTIAKLERDCKLLQETLHNNTPFTQNGCPTATPMSYRVPYEALGTLRINKLSLGSAMKSESVDKVEASWSTSQLTDASTEALRNPLIAADIRGSKSVSSQTIDTAFALCARCSETQDGLVRLASSFSLLLSAHHQRSSFTETDWASLAKVGGVTVNKWENALKKDMEALNSFMFDLEGECVRLKSDLAGQIETVRKLETESQVLGLQIGSLETGMEAMRRKNESLLAENTETFQARLRELEEVASRQELRNREMKDELNSAQKREAHLRAQLADLEHRRGHLQSKLQSLEDHEKQLMSARADLEKELGWFRAELEELQEQLELRSVDLNKVKVHNNSLEKKNKSLQAKQSSLIARLDELHQECDGLHCALEQAVTSQDELMGDLEKIQTQCNGLQITLEEKQHDLLQSVEEQGRLSKLVSNLETELVEVKGQLQEELHNCRLLMDYPFLKQTSENYSEHIAGLSGKETRKQISANTIRILLLEEQNAELREKVIPSKQPEMKGCYQVNHPTQLWQGDLLSKAHDSFPPSPQQNDRQKTKIPHKKPTKGTPISPPKREQTPSKLRGRLGHLVSAIADAHRASTSTPLQKHAWLDSSIHDSYSGIDVHFCSNCDRMFPSRAELKTHLLDCNNNH